MNCRLNPNKKVERVFVFTLEDAKKATVLYRTIPEGTIICWGLRYVKGQSGSWNVRFRGCGELDAGNMPAPAEYFQVYVSSSTVHFFPCSQDQDGGTVELWPGLDDDSPAVWLWVDIEIDDYADRGRPPGDYTASIPRESEQ